MVLVYFRGYGDWFVDDDKGHPLHLIKKEDRGTFISTGLSYGYQFYRPCDLLEGVFALTVSDEKLFQMTGNLADIKTNRLLPVRHHDGAFIKMIGKGLLSDEIFERCYFKIATNRYRRYQLKRQPELVESGKLHYDLVLYKSITDETLAIIDKTSKADSVISEQQLTLKEITTYRNTISVLISAITGEFPGIKHHPCFSNKIELIDSIKTACDPFNIEIEESFYYFSVVDLPSENEELRDIDFYEEKYLKFIGILLNFIFGKLQNTTKHPDFKNQGLLLDAIDKQYDGYFGLSKSNLAHLFPKAKNSLKASI